MPYPFSAFNFRVLLTLRGSKKIICDAEFSDCDGLEMSMAPKTIREGGANSRQIHLAGPMSYGQLSLKRGMTDSFDLWDWFEKVRRSYNLRADGEIHILSSSREREKKATFNLAGCLPLKLKAPTLNAKDGQIAIEEMQIAYETLSISKPRT